MDRTLIIYGSAVGNDRPNIRKIVNSGKETVLNTEDIFSVSDGLDKKNLEVTLLNNYGLLYAMSGNWDQALLMYERSLYLLT